MHYLDDAICILLGWFLQRHRSVKVVRWISLIGIATLRTAKHSYLRVCLAHLFYPLMVGLIELEV